MTKIFIKYEDIESNDVTIDTRCIEDWLMRSPFEYNCALLSKSEHNFLKKHKLLFVPMSIKHLMGKKESIKASLLLYSRYGTKRVILGCSKARLRSPIIYLYAKYLGLDARILQGGINGVYNKHDNLSDKIKSYFEL